MTYRCGIGPGMAAIGLAPREPHFECDGDGCDAVRSVGDFPPRWFLAGKPPPGWRKVPRVDSDLSDHYCRDCSTKLGLR